MITTDETLSSLVPPSFTDRANIFTEPLTSEYWAIYNDLTSPTGVQPKPIDSIPGTLTTVPNFADLSPAQEVPPKPRKNVCQYCNKKIDSQRELSQHISSHFPIQVQCIFPPCKSRPTTIPSLKNHFAKYHANGYKKRKKTCFQLATEAYNTTIKAHGGFAGRIAQPIIKKGGRLKTLSPSLDD